MTSSSLLTATATDANGNTSEFGLNRQLVPLVSNSDAATLIAGVPIVVNPTSNDTGGSSTTRTISQIIDVLGSGTATNISVGSTVTLVSGTYADPAQ